MPQITCWIDACRDAQTKWGMCPHHHQLWITHFPPKKTRLTGKSEEERFWFYMDTEVPREVREEFGARTDCWAWSGALNNGGYGFFSRPEGSRRSHALSLEIAGIDIPEGFDPDHLCRFRPCGNPEHLEPVPGRVNYLRGVGVGAQNARKTHCSQGHEYTSENALIKSNGWRACRACDRESSRAYASKEASKERRREAYQPKTGVRGKGQYQKEKTHCKRGHPLAGDNLILENRKRPDGSTTQTRRCRECTLAKARDNHAKRKGGVDLRRSDETCRNGHVRTEENTRWFKGKRACQDCRDEWRERQGG